MNQQPGAGRVGPNAILQFLPVLEREIGTRGLASLLAAAGIEAVPDGSALIDERSAARLHHAVREQLPDTAPGLACQAGRRTADYIIRHRIPRPARWLLRVLPRARAEKLLARSIEQHAWTFAGSGEFIVVSASPLTFEIRGNPMVAGEESAAPLCQWHCAVFERLYSRLLRAGYAVRETSCRATGATACRFEVHRLYIP